MRTLACFRSVGRDGHGDSLCPSLLEANEPLGVVREDALHVVGDVRENLVADPSPDLTNCDSEGYYQITIEIA